MKQATCGYREILHRCREPSIVSTLACAAVFTLQAASPALAADLGRDAVAPGNPATTQELLPKVVIVGTAPLPGIGLPLEQVPSNVQTAGNEDLKRQQAISLADYLNNNFSGISFSESQDNPFQPDVNYHGFTASALLGAPEGLSVFVDGVRVNESFGDTVNWDLIPENAISNVTLTSGSTPLFGLNTLGGALAVLTKNGREFPGSEIQAYGGSFGRRAFQAETGSSSGDFDYFLAGSYFDENGWRDQSPSRLKQLFGKAGWQDGRTDVDISYTWADTRLIGNGPAPESLLALYRSAAYTIPDITRNELNFVSATGSRFLHSDLLLSANAYYRHLITHTLNGDLNDDNYLSGNYSGPDIDCAAPFADHVSVAYCADGVDRTSATMQKTWGMGVQLTEAHDILNLQSQLVIGASYDRAAVDYDQNIQYATLTHTRTTQAVADPNNPVQTATSVGGTTRTFGVYVSDTLSPDSMLHITAAVRYNRISETLNGSSVDADIADATSNDEDPGGGGFDISSPVFGDHTYSRVNPSIGATLTPSSALTVFASYNEGSRAPTVIELGCSNPARPCGLPNNFGGDPDLRQVVARTFELGARGSIADHALIYSVNVFRTNNSEDIQFVATSTSQGYFDNVGTTRRQGFDLGLGGKLARELTWHFVYSFVDATYRSSFQVTGESNSSADDNGNIQVRPGNRIALIARHSGRFRLDYFLNDVWEIGGSFIYASGVYLHGNENNANVPDGDVFIGSGKIGGYGIFNVQSTWHLGQRLDAFVKIDNLFNKRYATAGFLTHDAVSPDGSFRPDRDDWTNENLVSPGQPVAVFVGLRLKLH